MPSQMHPTVPRTHVPQTLSMKATAKVAKEPTRETEQSKAVAAKKMSIVMNSGPESQNFFHEERIDDVISFFFSEAVGFARGRNSNVGIAFDTVETSPPLSACVSTSERLDPHLAHLIVMQRQHRGTANILKPCPSARRILLIAPDVAHGSEVLAALSVAERYCRSVPRSSVSVSGS